MNPVVLFYLHIEIDSTILISKTGVIVVLYHEGVLNSLQKLFALYICLIIPMSPNASSYICIHHVKNVHVRNVEVYISYLQRYRHERCRYIELPKRSRAAKECT